MEKLFEIAELLKIKPDNLIKKVKDFTGGNLGELINESNFSDIGSYCLEYKKDNEMYRICVSAIEANGIRRNRYNRSKINIFYIDENGHKLNKG